MTDYESLQPSVLTKIEGPSVNTLAITQIDLDARITAAFADGANSKDVAILIKDAEHGAVRDHLFPAAARQEEYNSAYCRSASDPEDAGPKDR